MVVPVATYGGVHHNLHVLFERTVLTGLGPQKKVVAAFSNTSIGKLETI
jgi:hypothetical protein